MTRIAYIDEDDQTALALDAITQRQLGIRPAGEKPMGPPEWYCHQPLVIDDARIVTCYAPVHYGVDAMTGQTITVCTRPGCGHVAVVPRVRMVATVHRCTKCHRKIEGDNAIQYETRDPGCKHCVTEKNQRARDRERAKRENAA